jgi:hypothetical protein
MSARNETESFLGRYDFGRRNAGQQRQANDCNDGHFPSPFDPGTQDSPEMI